jgi:ribose transport system ATP-binding protein
VPAVEGVANATDFLVEIRDVVKRFPGVVALSSAHLRIRPGEVHALLGENGAGKSTLIKLLSGVYQPDEGSIYLRGVPVRFSSPRDAQAHGITTIYQEHTLAYDLSPVENIFLGRELRQRTATRKGLTIDETGMRAKAERLWALFGGDQRDLDRPIRDLGGLKQRLIEIIKALAFDSQLVIMDEPTAQLPDDEREMLLAHIRKMAEAGVAVLLVTHRIEEIFGVAENVTVFRDGRWIDTKPIGETSVSELIHKMIGRDMGSMALAVARPLDQPLAEDAPSVLKVSNLSRHGVLRLVDLDLRAGEILGIGGLAGSGRTELARAIIGADPIDDGKIWVNGRQVNPTSPADALRAGIFMLPEERKTHGIVAGFSVAMNTTLSAPNKVASATFVETARENAVAEEFVQRLGIKTRSVGEDIENLSGGNQQKVLFARALFSEPNIIIVDEPTQGIDVGAKTEVYRLIRDYVANGNSAIVISSDLPELIGLSDRVLVMRGGRKAGEVPVPLGTAGDPTRMQEVQHAVMTLATGGGDAS